MSTAPIEPLPTGYTRGFVTARFTRITGDTVEDADRYPEARGSNGFVIFTPVQSGILRHLVEPTAFIERETVRGEILNGVLVDAHGLPGIWLAAPIEYRVSFQLASGNVIPPFNQWVLGEHTETAPLDLVLGAPPPAPSGILIGQVYIAYPTEAEYQQLVQQNQVDPSVFYAIME